MVSKTGNHGVVLVLFSLAAYVFLFPLIPLRNALLWKAEENAERSSVKLVDWNAMISGTAKFASDKAGSVTLDPLYLVFNSTRTDSMHRIMDIQDLAPRHSRQSLNFSGLRTLKSVTPTLTLAF